MKSFISATLDNTVPPKGATECNTCDGGVTRTTGQESVDQAPAEKPTAPAAAQNDNQNAVVVMQGPLGSVITEALNKELNKKAAVASVQVPATESFAFNNHVQANGQIRDVPTFINRISKSVGLVPATDEEPTAINTLLDCASKVDDIEFIMVGKVETDPSASQVPQKSIMHIVGIDGVPNTGNEQIAIESVQVVVKYKHIKG